MATAITTEDLTKQDGLQTPAPIVDTNNYQGIVDSAIKSVGETRSTLDAIYKKNETDVARVGELGTLERGKTSYSAMADEEAGVNTERANLDKYNQNLNDINANIAGLSKEAVAIPLDVQQKNANVGATDRGVAPQTTGRLRENAIKALTQSALADIVTANINNSTIRYNSALEKSKKAVDLKFKPIEDEIAQLKDQLALNKEYITDPKEKKQAEAQMVLLNERTRLLAEAKDRENAINAIKLEVAKNDPSKVGLLDGVKTVDEAIKKAGSALQTTQNEIVKLDNGSTILIDKRTGKTIRNLGGGTSSDVSIPTGVVRTVQTGKGSTPVSGYTLKAGDDPYFIAKQFGTSMETLKKLNPSITDWTKLPVGAVVNLPNTQDSWLSGKTEAQVQAYNSLPDADKASVKQLVTGEALLTDIVKSRGAKTQGQIQKLINQATAIDPSFSVNANKIRYQYQKDWDLDNTKGNVGTKTAINTALGHLADLKEASKLLPQGTIKKMNSAKNVLNKEFGDPAVTSFRINLTALATELARAYKGGVPNEGEIKEWETNLAESFSKQQFNGAFNTASKLLTSKITGLRYGYKSAMGREFDQTVIDPDKRQALIDAGIDPNTLAKEDTGFGVDETTPDETVNQDPLLNYFTPSSLSKKLPDTDFLGTFKIK